MRHAVAAPNASLELVRGKLTPMIGTIARTFLVLALAFGGSLPVSMNMAMEGNSPAVVAPSSPDGGGCDQPMPKSSSCVAACAIGCAALPEIVPMSVAVLRDRWPADDREASGVLPAPALAPPRL